VKILCVIYSYFYHSQKLDFMKKMYALIFVLMNCSVAYAQYDLAGVGYSQNFDDLNLGIPEGWQTDTNAKAGALGGMVAVMTTPGTATRWNNASGGFKNVASANGFSTYSSATGPLQLSATDRALAVRQTGSYGDPGAAFTFQVNHTYGLSDFEMDLKMQTLDSPAGRSTDWLIQYAIGDDPVSFNTVASYTSGGFKYENTPLTVVFGSVLDDQREKVWIRIVSLTASTGGGSRTTTGIDDIELRWNGWATPGFRPLVQRLFPANGSVDVSPGSILSVDFSKNIALGINGSVTVKNETDNTTQVIHAGSSFFSVRGKTLSIAGVRFVPAKSYHVTFDSSIVDTASATTYALEDTSEWRFTISSGLLPPDAAFFDTGCANSNSLPAGWSKFSGVGAEEWHCNEYTAGNSAIMMYGNDGAINAENEDWLISPLLNLSSPDASLVTFSMYKRHSGIELQVMLSDTYAGSGSPDSASWTPVLLPLSAADIDRWVQYQVPVTAFKSHPLRVGFKYVSNTAAAYGIQIDSFGVMSKTGISNNLLPQGNVKIIDGENGKLALLITGMPYGDYEVRLFHTLGQCISTKNIAVILPVQHFSFDDVNLLPGLYVLSLQKDKQRIVQKFIIR
jgi:hypothetical protein